MKMKAVRYLMVSWGGSSEVVVVGVGFLALDFKQSRARRSMASKGKGRGGGCFLMSRMFIIYKDAISSLPNFP